MKLYWHLLSLSVLLVYSCKPEHNHQPDASNYLVTLPVVKDTLVNAEYIGQIRAIQHIELRALEKGYLRNIYVDEGQKVKKGQILFQILSTLYEAEVQKARAETEFARLEYINSKILADSGIVSVNELAMSKARYDKAKAELFLAETHLEFTQIKAPFDGIIGRFNEIRMGSLLEEGELLTTLSDNSKMWVYFNVPESEYLNYVSERGVQGLNQQVFLKMANGAFFEAKGKVETIEADFNNETGNIAFRATFNNENGALRHSQTGKIYLPRKVNSAILIPQKATFEVLDKKYVYVVKNHKIKAQQVQVGVELPHIYQILTGISEHDTLLVEGLRKVKNGDKIKTHFSDLNHIVRDLNRLHAE